MTKTKKRVETGWAIKSKTEGFLAFPPPIDDDDDDIICAVFKRRKTAEEQANAKKEVVKVEVREL